MQINSALLESSAITKHFMTDRERRTKKALCQLLIDRGHRKYAERFWKLDFNIVDSKKHPDFTAAISFDEAVVLISDGFLGSGQGIFNQLDVLLRHELAHNLMMHQIRLMYVFKKLHASNPDEAYEQIRYSASLHEILNYIEDFEISNKRYTAEDKKIVRNMQLNGRIIGGLVTEDHRDWDKMSLEDMYNELSNELIKINSEIRSNPYWAPTRSGSIYDSNPDHLKVKGAKIISLYKDYMKPSGIKAPIDIFMKSKIYKGWPELFQNIVKTIYEHIKDYANLEDENDKQLILDSVKAISLTGPQEAYDFDSPFTGEILCKLYTPEAKMLASDVLKNLAGSINYDPLKFNVKKKSNSQEYKDAWNKVITSLDKKQFDDEILSQLRDAINAN